MRTSSNLKETKGSSKQNKSSSQLMATFPKQERKIWLVRLLRKKQQKKTTMERLKRRARLAWVSWVVATFFLIGVKKRKEKNIKSQIGLSDRDRRKVKHSLFKLRLCSPNTFDELFKMEMPEKSEEMKERVVWSRSLIPTFLIQHKPGRKWTFSVLELLYWCCLPSFGYPDFFCSFVVVVFFFMWQPPHWPVVI